MCMRAYQGKCPQLLFFWESGWRYPGLRQHRHRIFFPKQIWVKICLWRKKLYQEYWYREYTGHFCAISAMDLNHCKFIVKSQTHQSHVYMRSDHTRAGLELFSCTAGLLLKWWKKLNTFWFYRTNETWQRCQRFYPNAWLVEEVVWKCCRRRLICKNHLILTMSLW